MKLLEEIAQELDKGAPAILYRQELAAILRKTAAAHGEDARVRKDAERYRWMRKHLVNWCHDDGTANLSWHAREVLDAVIDAVMTGANA